MTDATNPEDRRAPDDVAVTVVRHERRKNWHTPDDCEKLLDVDKRFADGSERMARIEKKLDENTTATQNVESSTKDLVEFFTSMKGAFKVLNWIGKLARPIGAITLMCTSAWGAWLAFKHGVPK